MSTLSKILILFCIPVFCNAQSKYEKFFNKEEKRALTGLYRVSLEEKWPVKELGVFAIYKNVNDDGSYRWSCTMKFDDDFSQGSPNLYGYIFGVPALIYDKDIKDTVPEEELKTVLSGWLYQNPERKDRSMPMTRSLFRDDAPVLNERKEPVRVDYRGPRYTDNPPDGRFLGILFDQKGKVVGISRNTI
ncbi:MAG: hypothetical protein KF870_07485 [Leadbetterella sp.]|nr:hypothetical protein [Leadbetterella sp.]